MTNKRTISFSLILIAFLFQACQESPTQVGGADQSNINQTENGLQRVQGNLQGPGGPDDDPCIDVNGNPILDCEGPGTNDPGSGGSSGITSGFHYTHIGTNERIYHAYSYNGINWQNPDYTDVTTTSNSKSDRGPSTVFFQGELYSFYKGENSDEISFTKTSNETTWDAHFSLGASLPGGSVYESDYTPAAVVFHDTLFVYFARNSSIWGLYSADGMNWDNTEQLTPTNDVENCIGISLLVDCFKPYAQFGAAVYNDQVVLMFPGNSDNGRLKVRTSSTGKTFFQNFTLFTDIEPDQYRGVSGVEYNGKLYMTFKGRYTNNVKIVETDLITANQRDITVNQGTARTNQTPSIATDGNRLVVVYKGNSSQNIFTAYSTNGTSWMGNVYAVGGSNNNAGPSLIYVPN